MDSLLYNPWTITICGGLLVAVLAPFIIRLLVNDYDIDGYMPSLNVGGCFSLIFVFIVGEIIIALFWGLAAYAINIIFPSTMVTAFLGGFALLTFLYILLLFIYISD